MNEISKLQQDAHVATLFGDTAKAADLYGLAVHTAWKRGCTNNRMAELMIGASDALVRNGMADDAFEGLRALAVIYIKTKQTGCALMLDKQLSQLYSKYPFFFPNVPGLRSFIRTACKKQVWNPI